MKVNDDLAWYVVRTQPKRENVAARFIRNTLNLEVCSPQIRYRKSTTRGSIWWVEAMFPGYIFVRFNCSVQLRAVCGAQGVVTVLKFGDVIARIDDSIIAKIKKGLNDAEQVVIQNDVVMGDYLKIVQGPMVGNVGEVLEVKPFHERVKVLIEFLGDERSVECDLSNVILARKSAI